MEKKVKFLDFVKVMSKAINHLTEEHGRRDIEDWNIIVDVDMDDPRYMDVNFNTSRFENLEHKKAILKALGFDKEEYDEHCF